MIRIGSALDWRIFLPLLISVSTLAQNASLTASYDDLIKQTQNLVGSKQLNEAGKLGEAAIRQDVARWEAYALVGSILGLQKRYEQAIPFFQKAIERAPQDRKSALQQAIDQARNSAAPKPAVSLFGRSLDCKANLGCG